jgi:hypothetical protein
VCVNRHQPVIEDLPRDGVQPGVRLIEQRHLGAGGEPDRDPEGRPLPARQILDRLARPQAKVTLQ